MPRHCATCNRSEKDFKFYGGFCEVCAAKRLGDKLPKLIELERCKRCGRIWVNGRFADPNPKALEEAIAQKMRGYRIHLIDNDDEGALLDITEEKEQGGVSTEKRIAVKVKTRTCDDCYKRASGYWEALIQLRGQRDRVERLAARMERYISKSAAFISKTEDVETGKNIYISSKTVASGMISHMELKYTSSFTLYGIKNGKRVFRNTYAIHL
jgi:NMD protein affecting ribosome stability and mRNA decay